MRSLLFAIVNWKKMVHERKTNKHITVIQYITLNNDSENNGETKYKD